MMSAEPDATIWALSLGQPHLAVEFLNRATLMIRNYNGGTPLGAAMRYGHADQLPAELIPKPPGALQKLLYRLGVSRPPFG